MDSYDLDADDHYIPDTKNVRIDTSTFEKEIRSEINQYPNIDDKMLVERIYKNAFTKTAVLPVDPDDETLICRYLSPAMFLQFPHTREIAYPTAGQFAERWECAVQKDYDLAVLHVLEKFQISRRCPLDRGKSTLPGARSGGSDGETGHLRGHAPRVPEDIPGERRVAGRYCQSPRLGVRALARRFRLAIVGRSRKQAAKQGKASAAVFIPYD